MSETLIDETFAALAEERSLHGIHLAGGEVTMDWERLEYAIRSAVRHGVSIDYLETNGHWCVNEKTAMDGFQRLLRAGLPGVLVSASLFHKHLCLEIRKVLAKTGRFEELRAKGFYGVEL
jgi:urease gamma subunit